ALALIVTQSVYLVHGMASAIRVHIVQRNDEWHDKPFWRSMRGLWCERDSRRMTSANSDSRPSKFDPSLKLAAQTVDLVREYGAGDSRVRALDGLSIELESGRFTAIMGSSGS